MQPFKPIQDEKQQTVNNNSRTNNSTYLGKILSNVLTHDECNLLYECGFNTIEQIVSISDEDFITAINNKMKLNNNYKLCITIDKLHNIQSSLCDKYPILFKSITDIELT